MVISLSSLKHPVTCDLFIPFQPWPSQVRLAAQRSHTLPLKENMTYFSPILLAFYLLFIQPGFYFYHLIWIAALAGTSSLSTVVLHSPASLLASLFLKRICEGMRNQNQAMFYFFGHAIGILVPWREDQTHIPCSEEESPCPGPQESHVTKCLKRRKGDLQETSRDLLFNTEHKLTAVVPVPVSSADSAGHIGPGRPGLPVILSLWASIKSQSQFCSLNVFTLLKQISLCWQSVSSTEKKTIIVRNIWDTTGVQSGRRAYKIWGFTLLLFQDFYVSSAGPCLIWKRCVSTSTIQLIDLHFYFFLYEVLGCTCMILPKPQPWGTTAFISSLVSGLSVRHMWFLLKWLLI